jgi:DinB superfamily
VNSQIKPLLSIYNVNSRLFLNSFKLIDDAAAQKRPNKKTNSMIFLALHLLDARFFLLSLLGSIKRNPFRKYVDWSDSIDEIDDYPPIGKILRAWEKQNLLLNRILSALSAKDIGKKLDMEFPDGKSALSMISFMAEHEAYHVGQLGLIRKYLGFRSVEF